MSTGVITKTGTLAMTFHKYEGAVNPFVWFVYFPLEFCNHTLGQVSGSMNADPINMIHTGQKPLKYGFNKELVSV